MVLPNRTTKAVVISATAEDMRILEALEKLTGQNRSSLIRLLIRQAMPSILSTGVATTRVREVIANESTGEQGKIVLPTGGLVLEAIRHETEETKYHQDSTEEEKIVKQQLQAGTIQEARNDKQVNEEVISKDSELALLHSKARILQRVSHPHEDMVDS